MHCTRKTFELNRFPTAHFSKQSHLRGAFPCERQSREKSEGFVSPVLYIKRGLESMALGRDLNGYEAVISRGTKNL